MFSESDQRSWMAVYTKTLVNFLAIPVKIDQKNKTAKFELFSVRTFLSLFLYCGVFLGYALLLILQRHFARDNLMAWFATNQLFECYSAFIFSANVYLVPTLVFLAAHAFPKISEISMDQNLSAPKYKTLILLGFASFLIGPLFLKLGEFLSLSPELTKYSFLTRLIMLFAVPSICNIVCSISVNISLVLTVSWISHAINICTATPPRGEEVDWARRCLDYYRRLEKHLGFFFFLMFSATLVMWMFALFLAITFPIGSSTSDLFILSCSTIGYVFMSLGFLFSLTAICNVNDDLHASLNNVIEVLLDLPASGEDKTIIKLIRSLEQAGPISPLGMFSIQRSTITSMISISVTYLIILVQFKMSY